MPDTTTNGRACIVLVVEDDQDDVVLLQRALKKASLSHGTQIETVILHNGLEALSSVAVRDLMSRLPDVVVVDLNMPVMSGERFLRLMRQELCLGELPAVVLTTSREKPIRDRALAAGADRVFVKPNSLSDLEDIARTILDIGAGRAPVSGPPAL